MFTGKNPNVSQCKIVFRLFGRRVGAAVIAALVFGSAVVATPAPAAAGCSRECHWRVVMGTCKTVFDAHVPCPLKQKVCGERICTQAIE
jgi:hypothetical protein